MDLGDDVRIRLAAWHFKEEAYFWWEVVEMEGRPVAWAGFVARFDRKYLSRAEEGAQLEKFINLKQ